MSLSVAIITKNEETNIRRTLESVKWADEIVVVDSGSTDKTCQIAREYGAKVFVEEWKGFAKQKNSAIEKCTSEWILSLDADEEVNPSLAKELRELLSLTEETSPLGGPMLEKRREPGVYVAWVYRRQGELRVEDELNNDGALLGADIPRRNLFLGRWIRRGGFYPDRKLRLSLRNTGRFEDRLVHEDLHLDQQALAAGGQRISLSAPLIHHAYPTLSGYIEHMNRYSDLGAEMVVEKKAGERGASAGSREQSARAKSLATEPLERRGEVGFSLLNIVIRPLATFLYNYFFRLGFLDGKEGLLLHMYHSVYVSWKYAKAWETSRKTKVQS